MNYIITKLLINHLSIIGHRYRDFNEAIGVLECVKQEIYRRMLVPYEQEKADENGDVF